MTVLMRTTFTFFLPGLYRNSFPAEFKDTIRNNLQYTMVRSLSTIPVTKNVSLLTGDRTTKIRNRKVENQSTGQKPLVVMTTWLMAQKKHIRKYAEVYVERGFDVLTVEIHPWQLLWPLKGTHVIATNVVEFLDGNRSYDPLLVHGFSVGGYVWGEVLVKILENEQKYGYLIEKIVGQVYDSIGDMSEMKEGIPAGVFPNNPLMRNALEKYMTYHLQAFENIATRHYRKSSEVFHSARVKAPALLLVSRADHTRAEKSNLRLKANWEKAGVDVQMKVWEDTPHVGHFRKYPEEYLSELFGFMGRVGVIPETGAGPGERVRAKL